MKNLFVLVLALLAVNSVFSATGMRSGDDIVITVPFAFLTIVGIGYLVREKIREIKLRRKEEHNHTAE